MPDGMSDTGRTSIVVMWTVPEEEVSEGDRIFESHGKWMTGHAKEGDAALLSYRIAKGPELSDPVDPTSAPTGNTIFTLVELYQSPAGVPEHWRQAAANWQDLPAFLDWSRRNRVSTLHDGVVVQALW
jgi:hypothetical protein